MKIIKAAIFFISVIVCSSSYGQNLLTTDEFLGYRLGTNFTYHYKVVDYFKHAAQWAPERMKLESYGVTNEGRELLLAIVSAPENMNRIDEIQKNNQRLSGQLMDKAGDVSLPTVVWLSYNVHGNEASSTEVAMKLLYEMISGKNDSLNNFLKNVVVIIDPCLNPDGRDRYVSWYHQMQGGMPDANPIAREHSEPWPGGRTNHYYFDLNRDWAWQTQIETQERMKKYQQWLPQIHCDFHEQYPNSPYYFAPAAEPYHQVVTTWQRAFQKLIGQNHATYFDRNGWLYFTKEVFDLFYPSYGDTYPLFNGSIGMTYEQAGHSAGGLDIKVNDGHLTLMDRIAHHFTTSISTIQVAAANGTALNMEYKKYFDNARLNGSGIYKSYIIRADNSSNVKALEILLKKNNIEYSYFKNAVKIKGYHFSSAHEENYTTQENDILITTCQSKGSLVRVLFEPNASLADSLTYDITSWALPYVFGLDCYAVSKKIEANNNESSHEKIATLHQDLEKVYGVVFKYQSFSDAQILAELLNEKIKVKFSEKDLSIQQKQFPKGSLIVLSRENAGKMELVKNICEKHQKDIAIFNTGLMDQGVDMGSDKIHTIKNPVVALLTGDQASANASGEVWYLFEKELNYPITLIDVNDIATIDLKGVDVLIIPDGSYKILNEKDNGIKNWVKQGGKLVAIENAALQIANADWGIKLKKEDLKEDDKIFSNELVKFENRERADISNNIPGAIYKLKIDNSHPLGFGYPDFYFSLKMNANVFEYTKDAWNVGIIEHQNPVAGFVGSNAKRKIREGAVIVAQNFGNGNVIYFADDPIFRDFWEGGKLMFANAIFFVGQ